jgi:hypothetical protein
MKRSVIRRDEMLGATLELGGTPIALDEYATTGLLSVAIGPRGNGKTNAGLLMAEQLSEQGWVSVLIDPENELESLYGDAVADPDALREAWARAFVRSIGMETLCGNRLRRVADDGGCGLVLDWQLHLECVAPGVVRQFIARHHAHCSVPVII